MTAHVTEDLAYPARYSRQVVFIWKWKRAYRTAAEIAKQLTLIGQDQCIAGQGAHRRRDGRVFRKTLLDLVGQDASIGKKGLRCLDYVIASGEGFRWPIASSATTIKANRIQTYCII